MMGCGPLHKLRGLMLPLGLSFALLTGVRVRSAQDSLPRRTVDPLPPPSSASNQATLIPVKPKQEPRESKLVKTKSDAAKLSALADQLRDELNKMNVNVYSLDVLHKTEKLEQLAKQIKEEASGR
jgi:hypothetical protein